MFDVKEGKRSSFLFISMLAAPCIIGIGMVVPLGFTSLADKHPMAFAIIANVIVILVAAVYIWLFTRIQDRKMKQDRETHYIKLLKKNMPQKLYCNVATVEAVVHEKAECWMTVDGQKLFFGYVGFKNLFWFVPGAEVALVTDHNGFFAFIKRDAVTESLYR